MSPGLYLLLAASCAIAWLILGAVIRQVIDHTRRQGRQS